MPDSTDDLNSHAIRSKGSSINLPGGPQSDPSISPVTTDVRDLQRQLKARGVEMASEADESTTGPASFIAVDPDRNPILVDQHV